MDKCELREKMMVLRRNMTKDEVDQKSRTIYNRMLELGKKFFTDQVFIYISFDNEVKTVDLIDYLLGNAISVCVPVMSPDDRISAVRINSMEGLIRNRFGILEPASGTRVSAGDIGNIIIPGLAFDREMNRIGFGRGYFDDFLKDVKAKKTALAYQFQVFNRIPSKKYDIKMDMIITENEIIE